jgi:DNA-binding response OmpR family regulator
VTGAPPSVVIVDDEPHIRRLLEVLMSKGGFDVTTAGDGVEGLERIREVRPALVLLDANMPIMDGYTMCRKLREDLAADGPYVIMLTAGGQVADAARARDAGVDEFMTKPFNPTDLLRRAREVTASS